MNNASQSFIVGSTVRRALAEASAATTISAEALAWVNDRAAEAVALCAASGRRTPSGRLMAPPEGAPASLPVVFRQPDPKPAPDGRRRPERLDARAKEWRDASPEEKTAHLHTLYVSAPTVNEEAISILRAVAARPGDPLAAQAAEIARAADELAAPNNH